MRLVLFFIFANFIQLVNAQNSFEGIIDVDTFKNVYSNEIVQTSSNDYVIVGAARMNLGFSAGNHLTKLDSLGNLVWRKIYPPPCGQAAALFINELKNGNYLQCGVGTDFCQGQGLQYGFCSSFDTSGNQFWTLLLGGDTFNFHLNDVIADLDKGFTIVGCREETDSVSAVILKFDSTSNLVFERRYFTSSFRNFNLGYNIFDFVKIEQNVDSSYYILGAYAGRPEIFHLNKNGFILDTLFIIDSLGPGEDNVIVDFHLKDSILYSCISTLSLSGLTKQFFYEINILNAFVSKRILITPLNSFFPLNRHEKYVMPICSNFNSDFNTRFDKIDSAQNILWTFCVHPEVGILNTHFNLAHDKNIIFTSALDSFFIYQYEDVIYFKLDSSGTILNIPSFFNPSTFVELYPNPVTDKFQWKILNGTVLSVSTIDVTGRKLEDFPVDGNFCDISHYKPGVYILKFLTDQRVVSKILIKK